MSFDYDLVVLGCGPAGEKGAARAAFFGKRVAIVELAAELGGACTNTGTLPSKTLRESALYLSGLRQRDIYGLEVAVRAGDLSVRDFMVHKDLVVARERERIARNLARHHIALLRGRARFVDAHTVAIADGHGGADRRVSAGCFLIATGSRPRRPPEIPFEDPDIDDSDEILALDRIPASLIVVGGGVIGCEYASIFAALGRSRVTLIESRPRLLSFLDEEIGERLTAAFRRLGMELILGDSVARYEKPAGGRGARVTLHGGRVLEAERLLAAAGRAGNTEGLGLEAIGVELDARGQVVVDEHFRTRVGHVYAAGDVIGFPALASTSMEQGRVAVAHAFALGHDRMAATFPYGVYTIPEVSMVGETEAQARARGAAVVVGRAAYTDNARGQIINDPEGMVKLIVDAGDRRLLGAHLVGERATELVHVAQAVMALGGGIDYFIDSVLNYPTLSELYKYAAYDALGQLVRQN